MARLNQWAFRGFNLNQPGARVRDMTGEFSLPPLRGSDFLTMSRTGQLFVPKLHDERHISLEIVVYEDSFRGVGGAQGFFDQLATLFANRTQGALTYTDLTGYTRTGQAECVGWTPADQSVVGLVFKGVADFLLADPWLYGPTVTGSVTPNAGLAFGTCVGTNISGPRTTWAVTLTGVVSGQPIIVVHATQGYATALSSIADTFAGHYTYTRVDGNNTGTQDVEIYIGTGGTGTSGTVTITASSGNIGGYVIPMVGAATGVGLLAIDVHANATGTYPAQPSISVTPSAPWEGALIAVLDAFPSTVQGFSPTPAWSRALSYSGSSVENTAGYLYPASGAALTATENTSSGAWNAAAAIVKGSGTPATLNITNLGTATAEKLTLDFLGPIISPTITNMTNGTSVTVNTTVAGSTHLVVDTGVFTALNNGGNVIGSVVHAIVPGVTSWLTLAPGLNALQVSGGACTGATLVTVSFAPPYV